MIKDYGGVAHKMPWFAALAVLFFMANSGLPGTSGFVGEFMVILAAFQANFWYAFAAAATLILGAAYSLWLVKRVIFGKVANNEVQQLKDINAREALVLGAACGTAGATHLPPELPPGFEEVAFHVLGLKRTTWTPEWSKRFAVISPFCGDNALEKLIET